MKWRYLVLCILFSGCLKTSEELRREKIVDTMSVQMKESQEMMANLNLRLQEFQEKAQNFQGQVEELEHKQKELTTSQTKRINENLEQLNAQMAAMQKAVDQNSADLKALQEQVNSQKKFVSKVTKSLSGIGAETSPVAMLDQGIKLVDQKKYKEAKPILSDLLNANLSAAKKNKLYYHLGLIEYAEKDYEECLVYMSKIFTKWPKSSYAAKSLLYIARSFRDQGKKDEAKASYQTLIKDYAGSKHAKIASAEIKKI